MSLNFFKPNPQKTDATLQFKSVLNNLNDISSSSTLDIDQFIQQETIHLRQHQDFYKESNNKGAVPPISISNKDDQMPQGTRLLVNSLIELSKTMPELKLKALESNEKAKAALEDNDNTISDIRYIQPAL